MPKAFENPDGTPKLARVKQTAVAEFQSMKSPMMLRTEKGNEIIDLLNDDLYYINVTLLDEGGDEVTVRVLALDDNAETLEGGGSGGGGGTAPYPFEATITNQASPSTDADVTIYPGSFDNIIASNFDSTFVIPQTGDRYLVATVTFSSGAVSGVSYSMDSSPPTAAAPLENAPPTSQDILLVLISDGVAFQIQNSSLTLSAALKHKISVVGNIGPGESPWEYYYAWAWS